MKTFGQFLIERKYQYLFHGTSSVYKNSIQQHGLLPGAETSGKETKEDGVYLTTDFHLAVREAGFTVNGENGEEGVGGSKVVVVIDRTKVRGLRRDNDYHMFGRMKDSTAFIASDAILPTAIVDVVSASSTKYRDANSNQIVKQIGIKDKDGNPIVDLDGKTPEIRHSQKLLKVFAGSDSSIPPQHIAWTTKLDSDHVDGYKYRWMIIGRPEEFMVVDQLHGEVLLEPTRKILGKAQILPKSYKDSDA